MEKIVKDSFCIIGKAGSIFYLEKAADYRLLVSDKIRGNNFHYTDRNGILFCAGTYHGKICVESAEYSDACGGSDCGSC